MNTTNFQSSLTMNIFSISYSSAFEQIRMFTGHSPLYNYLPHIKITSYFVLFQKLLFKAIKVTSRYVCITFPSIIESSWNTNNEKHEIIMLRCDNPSFKFFSFHLQLVEIVPSESAQWDIRNIFYIALVTLYFFFPFI